MAKEFNLSEKAKVDFPIPIAIYFEEDVKEFIKKLKEELFEQYPAIISNEVKTKEIIDKLAGDKLSSGVD